MTSPDGQATTITLDDPELAAIFERIARAIPNARVNAGGLAPRELLRLYAELVERGESVSISTCHLPIRDPQLD